MRKFLTNSKPLQARIDCLEHPGAPAENEPTYSEATLGNTQPARAGEQKVLGVPWNPDSDLLIFDVSEIARLSLDLLPTKRNIVSVIGRFYDPVGFLTPVIVRFKVLFQKLCQLKSGWDEVIPDDVVEEWKNLIAGLYVTAPVSLPRSYLCGIEDSLSSGALCGFCDASTRAYVAVVYLLLKTENRTVVRFVASKTRIAPLQSQTIPRLELLSAFLLSKLIISVRDSLQHQNYLTLQAMQCYTDSQVALFWIRGKEKEWKPFVQNRVDVIRHNVHPDLWQHCPGITNPADLPTRGLTMIELAASQLWRSGPEWLSLAPPTPVDVDSCEMPEPCSLELRSASKPSHSLLVVQKKATIGDLVDCETFSDLHKLCRVTAYVLRAVNHFKKRKPPDSESLTPQEIAAAEILWASHAQRELALQKNFSTLKGQLGLFTDEKGL